MSKKRRKTEICQNCGHLLKPQDNYCSVCGQENNDQHKSFGKLISDFFTNYFSLDSRFGRSIKPFFLQPGHLTNEFVAGRRVNYGNPIRIYLVVTLIHFFFFNWYMDSRGENESVVKINQPKFEESEIDEFEMGFTLDSTETKVNQSSDLLFFRKNEWAIIQGMIGDKAADYSVEQIEDSIHNETKPVIPRHFTHQFIKLMKSNSKSISAYIISKIPMVMFFLLPLYALILKLFFIKRYYITHIIHSLHIHSFTFFILSIIWILGLMFSDFAKTALPFSFLICFVYIYFSFTKVYGIKRLTSIFKVSFSGLIYSIILAFGLAIGTILSLLTF